jgi:oligopeptide/dipeptide ABC transporter ATP-binding protein
MSKEVLLEIKNLTKTFPIEKNFFGIAKKNLRAVNDFSLDIKTGECVCIVGESGCGKSTAARLILNLIKPDSGEVIFQSKNILKLPSNELRKMRKDMQMVFQNPFSSLDPRFKIFDSIAEPLRVHKVMNEEAINKRVFELLELVELDDSFADKYPHQCSGGQNQRISIARAIALNPKFIIADEAVSALDVQVQWKILNLIDKIKHELGISFLFIAHNLAVVKHIADRVAVMYLGEIVELGSKEEVFNNPQHPYTRALISSAPIPNPHERDRKKVYLKGEIPKATDIPSGCPFHTRCPIAEAKCSEIKPKLEIKPSGQEASCLLVN